MDSELSYDMKMEILSRTSLKTLDAMRCLNKEFNNLAYETYLFNMYKKRNNIVSGLIVQTSYDDFIKEFVPSRESASLDLSFLPKRAVVVASSEQGILVFETYNPRRVLYNICKPATKQVLQLPPNLIKRYRTVMVAVNIVAGSTPLRYKIVRLCRPVGLERVHWPSTYCCEVFDSAKWQWRQLSNVTLPNNDYFTLPSITTRGSTYILLKNGSIMKFNTYSEEWTTFSSPNATRNIKVYPYRKLVKYQDKLGFACTQLNDSWEIWVLVAEETWEKTLVLNKEEYTRSTWLEALYDSDTSITLDDNIVSFHGSKEYENISKVISSCPPYETFLLRSDFEQVDLGENKSR